MPVPEGFQLDDKKRINDVTVPEGFVIDGQGETAPSFTNRIKVAGNRALKNITNAAITTAGNVAKLPFAVAPILPESTKKSLSDFIDDTEGFTRENAPPPAKNIGETTLDVVSNLAPFLATGPVGAVGIINNAVTGRMGELAKQGEKPESYIPAGVVSGTTAAAMMHLPMKNAKQAIASAAAMPVIGASGKVAENAIIEDPRNYQNPLDPKALLTDLVMGTGFSGLAHFQNVRAKNKAVDAVANKVEAGETPTPEEIKTVMDAAAGDNISATGLDPFMRQAVERAKGRPMQGELTPKEQRAVDVSQAFNGPMTIRDALHEVEANQADPLLAQQMAEGRNRPFDMVDGKPVETPYRPDFVIKPEVAAEGEVIQPGKVEPPPGFVLDAERPVEGLIEHHERGFTMREPGSQRLLTTPERGFELVGKPVDRTAVEGEVIPPANQSAEPTVIDGQIVPNGYIPHNQPLDYTSDSEPYSPDRLNFEIGLAKKKPTKDQPASKAAVMIPQSAGMTAKEVKQIAANSKLLPIKQGENYYLYNPEKISESGLRKQIKEGREGQALGYGTDSVPKAGIDYAVTMDGHGIIGDIPEILKQRDAGNIGFAGRAPDIETATAKIREHGRNDAEIQFGKTPEPPAVESANPPAVSAPPPGQSGETTYVHQLFGKEPGHTDALQSVLNGTWDRGWFNTNEPWNGNPTTPIVTTKTKPNSTRMNDKEISHRGEMPSDAMVYLDKFALESGKGLPLSEIKGLPVDEAIKLLTDATRPITDSGDVKGGDINGQEEGRRQELLNQEPAGSARSGVTSGGDDKPVTAKEVEDIRGQIAKLREEGHKIADSIRGVVLPNGVVKGRIGGAKGDTLDKKAQGLFKEANKLEDSWHPALFPEQYSPEEMADAISNGYPYLAKPAEVPTLGTQPQPIETTDNKPIDTAKKRPVVPASSTVPRNILTDIKQQGGINLDSLKTNLDSKEVIGPKGGNRYLRITNKNGVGLDQMAQQMADAGWQIPRDSSGNLDTNRFSDMIKGAINGDHPVHPDDVDRMARDYPELSPEEIETDLHDVDEKADGITSKEDLDAALDFFDQFIEKDSSEVTTGETPTIPAIDAGSVQGEGGGELANERPNRITGGLVKGSLNPVFADIHAEGIQDAREYWNRNRQNFGATGNYATVPKGPGMPESTTNKQWEIAFHTELNKLSDQYSVNDYVPVKPESSGVEAQDKLFATPPTFGKKPQKATTQGDVSTSDLMDNFTSVDSVQPDIFNTTKADNPAKYIEEQTTQNPNVTEAIKKNPLANERGAIATDLLMPGFDAAKNVSQAVKSLVLPTSKSPEHLRSAETLGAELGAMDRRSEIANRALKDDGSFFDMQGVHNLNTPLTENMGIKFMSDMSQGRPMTGRLQTIATKINNIFADRLNQLAQAGAELQTIRDNYFPGIWTNESRRAFNQAMEEVGAEKPLDQYTDAEKEAVRTRVKQLMKDGEGSDKDGLAYLTKRPFKGKESFRKQKVFDDIMTAVEFGLEPVSNNPIDLVRLKLAEMDRSIMANRALRKYEAQGDVKFLRVGQEMPEGYERINDKYGTVYGPPTVTETEHVDRTVYDGIMNVAADMGLDVERVHNAGRARLGYASPTGKTVTEHGSELSVLAHEIGHQLDFKYDLWDKIVDGAVGSTKTATAQKRGVIQKELRALADKTFEGSSPTSSYKQKVRGKAEKMAHMLEAYIHAPDMFKDVAPTVYGEFDSFIRLTPEISALADIKPGIALKELNNERYVGLPILGYRIAKTPVADIMNNYLSSSLYNNQYFGKPFKGYMATANLLNQSQLGVFSAFHAGFTAGEVQMSGNAEVIKDIYGLLRGNRSVKDVASSIGTSAVNLATLGGRNVRYGGKILDEWRTPTMEVSPDVKISDMPDTQSGRTAMIAKAAELAGGGFEQDTTLKTNQTDKMVKDWYSGDKIKAALRSPVALTELSAKPIMEYLVPRQKAGVFGELAGRIIEMNPDKTMDELTPQFRQAWNRVDARLGQVRYNRLFVHNAAKNAVQALVRAPGWSGGTIAEIGGSAKDTVNFLKEWVQTGKAPENIPDRVAYTVSLMVTTMAANAALTYALTGEKPEGMDYWAFRTGNVDEQGRPERFLLPTYAKDIYAYWQEAGHTLIAKAHPMLSLMGDVLIKNKDYYGSKIYQEDEAFHQKLGDVLKYSAKQFVPFWMRGAAKESDRAGNVGDDTFMGNIKGIAETAIEHPQKILAPQIGIMPATSAYTRSKAEKEISEIYKAQERTEGRTKEQAEYKDTKGRILRELRSGKTWDSLSPEIMTKAAKLTQGQLDSINRDSQLTPLQSAIKHITSADDALRVWKVATPKERQEVAEIFLDKINNHVGNLEGEQLQKFLDKLNELQ